MNTINRINQLFLLGASLCFYVVTSLTVVRNVTKMKKPGDRDTVITRIKINYSIHGEYNE